MKTGKILLHEFWTDIPFTIHASKIRSVEENSYGEGSFIYLFQGRRFPVLETVDEVVFQIDRVLLPLKLEL